jgi:hypothetical protein
MITPRKHIRSVEQSGLPCNGESGTVTTQVVEMKRKSGLPGHVPDYTLVKDFCRTGSVAATARKFRIGDSRVCQAIHRHLFGPRLAA